MSNGNKERDFAPINLDSSDRISAGVRRSSTQTIVKSNNGLVSLLLFVSLCAVGASVYLYLELTEAQTQLSQNNQRLESLEARLSATGEEMDSSTATLQVRVSELTEKADVLWTEMDKLWASAWRTNQKQIKDLENEVSSFKSDTQALVKQAQTKIETSDTAQRQLAARIESLNGKVTEQANNLLAAKVEQEALLQARQSTNTQIRDINEKVLLLERRNTSLLQQINELKQTLDELIKKSV